VAFTSQRTLFVYDPTAPSGPGTPHYRGFTITFKHILTGLPWTNDRIVAETSTWLHTTITWDTRPCSQRD